MAKKAASGALATHLRLKPFHGTPHPFLKPCSVCHATALHFPPPTLRGSKFCLRISYNLYHLLRRICLQ